MLYTAFILGLLGSFHCIGMCGPIAFALPVDRKSKPKMAFQTLLYHFGRLLTYSFIGLIFGLVGRGLYLAGFQQRLSILIGVLMIVMVLIPVHIFNRYNFSKPIYKGISYVKSKLGYYLKKRTNSTFFSIGFFNGFLPCGLVYMALVGSIAASGALEGAIYMFLFGLGTVPMMSAAVLGGNFLKGALRTKIQKVIPVFVVIIGLLFILRGLGLGIPYVSPSDAKLQVTNNVEVCE
ncbi:sulfite exporter TauE/SafE family protein [Aureibaculum sp. 2210JD6-5]|uniref:sulfite exporter TauE/SafE family protein n=1 Tax=Aureibaculum sp. 2210JD6-5 TaxID=3103957 RepID=UPI002AADBAE8|nr:sulfite exporter TauE/SafE family protein [Aureibaculum sp. 2210JD6-5]MDY7396669.1 sulfite exporter TauE/SafE family protein [Aureibaculum sp. 2210JD6-5]